MGVLALGCTFQPSFAATFTASNQAELYQAIADAQASADASSTITLTGSFALTSAFPAVTGKTITVETGTNTLTFSMAPAFDVAAGAILTFTGQLLDGNTVLGKTGSGTLVLDSTASGISRINLNGGQTIINGGGLVQFGPSSASGTAHLALASAAGSVASLTITGAGTSVVTTSTEPTDLSRGGLSTSVFTVEDGASFSTAGAIRIHTTGSQGTATINVLGENSSFSTANLGSYYGTTYINVLDGGVMNVNGLTNLGGLTTTTYAGALVSVIVSGEGSEWTNTGAMNLYRGSLSILDRAVLDAKAAVNIATSTGSIVPTFAVLVSGDGSELKALALNVGTYGTGTVTIADDGQVLINGGASALVLGGTDPDSNATLNIGGAVGAAATAAGTLVASAVTLAASAEINFNHTEAGYAFDTAINGSGAINQYAGRTIFNADQTGFSGLASIYGGMLEVNGILGGTINILGGTLRGIGRVGDTTTIPAVRSRLGSTVSVH
ncbi:hypothetical protein [Rhizobium sp. S96]|uniref:hypothetical protein n=1 Tax=Rhizobium sp. S96 TaxID=3055140 RepID=UPI0025AAA3D9|nr:hypothetical protein [Rhizobium sp. S96]MDM9621047.1 hypothetical protein [Rhizobium sp. S96]